MEEEKWKKRGIVWEFVEGVGSSEMSGGRR